ncbi:hypothetical protein SAMD00019534_086120 [Acytostelium subglobosum LB1]|uniref:hypothetical protein n=1 Tax=Acytostelium subglobosum LB1 TaxID=1410327 RepID=UPI000644957F|nr:hypothetical protein SAMD00019534_086120 [Acytostelium subglobosum LB1]GAM25437.1 hypothetical protein SAMD00019534_086120 [Acytostelium subglobosum LB1]|eukprot:XP_012751423.1 hypothetical protein SAMD00019534_086120 [Acytostelium subglobosum LB1]
MLVNSWTAMVIANPNSVLRGFVQNRDPTSTAGVLCEINTPVDWEPITTVGTNGGLVTFKRVASTSTVTTGTVTFNNAGKTFACPLPAGTTNTFTCLVPPGTGYWTYSSATINIYFQYEPPFLSYVYLVMPPTPKLTIVGGNFGNDISKVSVTVGLDYRVCTGVAFQDSGVSITCIPDIVGKSDMMPIVVTVDSVLYTSFRVPIVYQGDQLVNYLYSNTHAYTDPTNAQRYAQGKVAGTYGGFLGAIPDAKTYTMLTTTRVSALDTRMATLDLLLGVSRSGGIFSYNNGPFSGQSVTQYGAASMTADASQVEYYFGSGAADPNILKALAATQYLAFLVQFANTSPLIKQTITGLTTSGGSFNVTVSNYGLLYSKLVITNAVSIMTPDPTKPEIKTITYGAGYSQFDITLAVDGYNPATLATASYAVPTIATCTDTPTSGGSITMTGTNYYNTPNLVVLFDGVSIPVTSINYNNIVATVPPGYGSHSLVVSITGGSGASAPFTYVYQGPTLAMSTSTPTSGGNTILTGTNFFNNTTDLSVWLDGTTKLAITSISYTSITATVPAGYGTHTLSVKLLTRLTQTINLTYMPPTLSMSTGAPTSGGATTITGTNFYDTTNLTVTIDGAPIPVTSITFTNVVAIIPTGRGTSHQLVVSLGGVSTSSLNYTYQEPSITTTYLDQFGVFTIEGTSFGNDPSALSLKGITYTKLFIIEPHKKLGLLVSTPGQYTFTVIFDGQSSSPFNATVEAFVPMIESYSDITFNQPSSLVLKGRFFIDVTQNGTKGNVSDIGVSVGGSPCDVTSFQSNQITCSFRANVKPADSYALPIKLLFHSTNQSFTQHIFFYYQSQSCPSFNGEVCNGQGSCDPQTGQCTCIIPYGSSDCSIRMSTLPPPKPILQDNAFATITTSSVEIDVGVEFIREVPIDASSTPLNNILVLRDATWKVNTSTDGSTNHFVGTFPGSPCVVDITTTVYSSAQVIEFAAEKIPIPAHSVKYLITITGFPFVSMVNSLQVVYRANASSATQQASPCTKLVQTSDRDNWYEIDMTDSVMMARFAKRAIIDGRYSSADLKTLDKTDSLYTRSQSADNSHMQVLTAIEVPSFNNQSILDPNFGLLLREDQDNSKEIDGSTTWRHSHEHPWKQEVHDHTMIEATTLETPDPQSSTLTP